MGISGPQKKPVAPLSKGAAKSVSSKQRNNHARRRLALVHGTAPGGCACDNQIFGGGEWTSCLSGKLRCKKNRAGTQAARGDRTRELGSQDQMCGRLPQTPRILSLPHALPGRWTVLRKRL